ncbi:hypothetical protein BDZ91DRAFT_367047 [Kalaharituber pfeilii]|nr:hypothetical protein BDZ91DRAFT_367047 [Kalaharituber pfeilii]
MPPAKKSGRALLREEGLERTDNNLRSHTWPTIQMINQKNYYTEYLKREDQVMVYRQQQEENAKASLQQQAKEKAAAIGYSDAMDVDQEDEKEEEALGSKVIVIHPGSQNLRIGLASDALPKSIPNVIARRSERAEFELESPHPKRLKVDQSGEDGEEDNEEDEDLFGKEFTDRLNELSSDLKQRMRNNKRRILPNSKDLVISYNNRTSAEVVKEHNDPNRVEWTEVPRDNPPEYFVGYEALRIPDTSAPRYRLVWPMRHGWLNEKEYKSKRRLFEDISVILEEAMRRELEIEKKDIQGTYSAVLVVPDLYEKVYINEMLELLFKDFFFQQVCIIQESLAASFGAGFSQACIVDIGAQKTSVCCVEEGMCVAESRMNLKYGGMDVTTAFIKALLVSQFPYQEINLFRRYDYLLAEELKLKYYTLNDAVISVQVCEFHLRTPDSDTKKYSFKCYDEVMIAPMGYFSPQLFDHSEKLQGRRSLLERSYDIYDGKPDDPISTAQLTLYQSPRPSSNGNASVNGGATESGGTPANPVFMTPAKGPALNPFSHINFETSAATPRSSVAGSPAPEGTPVPGTASPALNGSGGGGSGAVPLILMPTGPTPLELAEERDKTVPILALDQAIAESISHAAKGDERKIKEYLGSIMIVGGGSLVAGLNHLLEERLRGMKRYSDHTVMVAPPPRELDPQVIVWKGASVFGKLKSTNDSWIRASDYDILGSRLLAYKCMWLY